MKFVVDSGSTKADWLLFNNKQHLGVYNTLGLNPEVLTTDVLVDRMLCNEEIANLQKFTFTDRVAVPLIQKK